MVAPKKRAQPEDDKDLFVIPSSAQRGGDYVRLQDLEDCLIVIRATSPEQKTETFDNGPAEYVEGQVLVVEGANELSGEWHDLWVFPVVVRRLIKDNYPNPVVGWLGRGEAAKGKSAPWVLTDPDTDDLAKAREAFLQAEVPF